MMSALKKPALPLAGFYFFYFAVLGGFMPYWGLYLQSLQFSAQEIGELTAIVMVTRLIAPNFWGYIADRTGQRLRLVRLGAGMMMVFCAGIMISESFFAVAFFLLCYGFFQNAILPQFEAITLVHLGEQRERYGRIRLWGSIGFIMAGAGLGWVFTHHDIALLPAVLVVLAAATWLVSCSLPDTPISRQQAMASRFSQVLRDKTVITLFTAHTLLLLSHAPYYTFYSIYLEAYDYSKTSIGLLWSLGVLAEVIAFWFMHRILPTTGEWRLLQISLLLSALRWLMLAVGIEHVAVVLLAQLLHAASFGTFHASIMALIYKFFGHEHQGKGQAVYSMLWGFGIAFGAWLCGLFWSTERAFGIYLIAALLCLLAWVITLPKQPSLMRVDQHA